MHGSRRSRYHHATDSFLLVCVCGGVVRHILVCGWLWVARRILKKRANSVTKGLDDETKNTLHQCMISETVDSVQRDDLVRGNWCTDGKEQNVWVDTSSLVAGVALERWDSAGGCLLEKQDPTHQPTQVKCQVERHQFGSPVARCCTWKQTVCVSLIGRTQVYTEAAHKMLIRRRLYTLKS